ncbi:MAG: dTDP-4-dehydrorhamnose 3,5-epimerase [Blastocatellia bacterium]
MKRIETELPGVIVIEPVVFKDERGFFFESYQERKFAELGIPDRFVQDNHSKSTAGTLRGLHYQITRPQSKLCRVIQGAVLDVVVDIRCGSLWFGQHVSVLLSAENMRQIYIPAGFAHGYLVLSETAEFLYKCSDFYFPEYERGVIWNDAEIGIAWGIQTPILSAKDSAHPELSKILSDELPRYE